MAERRKHESLEFLHEVTRLLARAPDISAGIAGLLQRTLDVAGHALALKDRHKFKTDMDQEALHAMFPHLKEKVA